MTPTSALAVLCGLGLGFGCWALVSTIPLLNRPRLMHRVAPYLVDVSSGARELLSRTPVDPLPIVGTMLTPVTDRIRKAAHALLGTFFGGADGARIRLRQAGSALTVEEFRTRQLLWAISGCVLGVAAAVLIGRAHDVPAVLFLAIVAVFAVGGVVVRDVVLQRAARQRLSRMSAELPTVLEFLTLSLSAGEGVLDALRRVARISHGELAAELAGVVTAVNTGLPFGQTLQSLADDLALPAFSRCVEQITGALDRGTPLAEVLRAQAQDARDDAKRDLLEVAGRKEVAMLVPLVFLILPVTIVYAIYPGVFVLQLGF